MSKALSGKLSCTQTGLFVDGESQACTVLIVQLSVLCQSLQQARLAKWFA